MRESDRKGLEVPYPTEADGTPVAHFAAALGLRLANLRRLVYYVDFENLTDQAWKNLLPTLARARAIVIDLRGYTSNAGLRALTNLTTHELVSPPWQIPIVGGRPPGEPLYETSQWTLLPASLQLSAPVVALVDGRAASAVETVLQMLRDHQLARFVGEPSAGTNGNVASFTVPGDFKVRFSGMRASARDNSTIQGRGIGLDLEVHPTIEGVRAHRDEILEAGVAEARRLAK